MSRAQAVESAAVICLRQMHFVVCGGGEKKRIQLWMDGDTLAQLWR